MLPAMPSTRNRRATTPTRRAGRKPSQADSRRSIPSVDALLRSPAGARASTEFGRPVVKRAVAITVAEVRAATGRRGRERAPLPDSEQILAQAVERAVRDVYGLGEVINASGVLLHTARGRAPPAGVAAEPAPRA